MNRREEHHRAFVKSCTGGVSAVGDYCECAWVEASNVLSEDELASNEPDPKKVEQFHASVGSKCAGLAPESVVKQNYIDACVGERGEIGAYCECTWGEFRKRFTAQQLADEQFATSETFSAARPAVVKECGAKMPESVVFDSFMKTCASSATSEHCACGWKEFKKLGSAAEIEAGLVSFDAARAAIEANCVKMRTKPSAKVRAK